MQGVDDTVRNNMDPTRNEEEATRSGPAELKARHIVLYKYIPNCHITELAASPTAKD